MLIISHWRNRAEVITFVRNSHNYIGLMYAPRRGDFENHLSNKTPNKFIYPVYRNYILGNHKYTISNFDSVTITYRFNAWMKFWVLKHPPSWSKFVVHAKQDLYYLCNPNWKQLLHDFTSTSTVTHILLLAYHLFIP